MSEEFSNDSSGSEPSEIASIAEGILSEPSQPSEYDTAPQGWKREVAERHWRTLDADLRGYLHSRDKETHEKITQQGQRMKELEGVSTRYQPIDGIFERYRPHIPEGLEPAQAIEALLNVQQMITTPETREQAFAQLIQSCGVDPMALLPPQMLEQFETAQRELQQTRVAEVQKTLDDFTKDKTYYAEIRDDVIKEIVEIRKGAPGLDNATVLRLAHDRVVDRSGIKSRLEAEAKANELAETLKRQAEQQKAAREENDRRVKAARRAADINVRSTPASSTAPKTMDDELRAIARRAYG
jgi:hypothetical protein